MTIDDMKKQMNLPQRLVGANFFLVLFISFSILLSSCDKSSLIGLNVKPDNTLLNVSFIDTTTLITKTESTTGLRTDQIATEGITTDALIGTYIDPVFGKTTASFYTQLRMNTNNPSFGTNAIIDSVILSLVYYDSALYGKTQIVKQNVNVFRILEDMNVTTTYYSNELLSVSSVDLASNFGFVANPYQTLIVNTTTLSPQLRIPLSLSFGQEILGNQGTSNLLNDTTFQSYLKGLYITTENTVGLNNGEGNIFRFSMEDIQTKLALYYHNDSASSIEFDFSFNSLARFSNFKHNYSSSVDPNLASQLSNTPPAQNDLVYIQPMGGTRVKIETPYIMHWLDSGSVAINKAEFVIKINTSPAYQQNIFAPPPQLVVYGINDDKSLYTLPDAGEGSAYFGGAYDTTTNEYRLDVARYFQQVLSGKLKNNGLYLMVLYEFINPGRVVIGGGGNANNNAYQMKLNITRTKIP